MISAVIVMGIRFPVDYRELEDCSGEYLHGRITLDPRYPRETQELYARHEAAHALLEINGVAESWKAEFGEKRAEALEEQVITHVILPVLCTMEIEYADEAP